MTLPFRPIGDRVVVRKDANERLLSSGLVIPHVDDPERQQADERDVAEVIGVGPGAMRSDGTRRPMSIAPGQKVVFGRNKGQMIRYHEQDYCVLLEEHVIGTLDPDGFKPLSNYIVAEEIKGETEVGGIIVPDFGDRSEAEVIAVGPGWIRDDGALEPTGIEPGDRILFNPRMAEPFRQGTRELLALRGEHIVCVSNRDA